MSAWVDAFLSWRHDLARRVEAEDIARRRAHRRRIYRPPRRGARAAPTRRRLEAWARRLARRGRRSTRRRERGARCRRSTRSPRAIRTAASRRRVRAELPVDGRSRARALRALVRAVPALDRASAGKPRHVRATARRGCRTSPRWASTCCTCRRSIRSAASSARAEQHARPPSPAISAARGRSAPPKAATRRCIRELGTLEDFRRLRARGAHARHRSRARHRVPMRARPSVRARRIRSGSGSGPTAACSTPRTRRRNTRTSIRSTSRPTTWRALWEELQERVRRSGSAKACAMFRVDNPHTKPFAFWEWVIGEIKREHPDAIFLAEAFTRPKVDAPAGQARLHAVVHLFHLAQHARHELTEYFTELTQAPAREYFRPNCWPNTPDILAEHLQTRRPRRRSSRASCSPRRSRANYGIYGPAFELLEHVPREPGQRGIPRLREVPAAPLGPRPPRQPARRSSRGVNAHPPRQSCAAARRRPRLPSPSTTTQLLCYASRPTDRSNVDARRRQSRSAPSRSRGGSTLDLAALGVDGGRAVPGARPADRRALHLARRSATSSQLDPARVPAHIFRVRRRVRSERDFDYFA